ncbi:hypothetical protein [Halosegnis longus]|uniref:hypothetical protein n=1 Tax=Halosegnis longus TaxID=2216012 RepID=UPI00129DA486|nr:hypothetical protein [Halosegnis longus]
MNLDQNIRIRYGDETEIHASDVLGDDFDEETEDIPLYIPRTADQCPDCRATQGEYHDWGCDIEQCPICQKQLLGCEHGEQVNSILEARRDESMDRPSDEIIDELKRIHQSDEEPVYERS